MPSEYVRALKLPLRSGLKGDDLHSTVIDLVASFQLNYNLKPPELNRAPIMRDVALELAIPSS